MIKQTGNKRIIVGKMTVVEMLVGKASGRRIIVGKMTVDKASSGRIDMVSELLVKKVS